MKSAHEATRRPYVWCHTLTEKTLLFLFTVTGQGFGPKLYESMRRLVTPGILELKSTV